MNTRRTVCIGVAIATCLLWSVRDASATSGAADDAVVGDAAPYFRVFLTDGSSLTSLGEPARIGDRVVFSMPTSPARDNTQATHLVDLPADRVNWPQTDEYAESVRAARYLATRAEADYAVLTIQMQRWLDDVAARPTAAARLPLAEQARRILADWPAGHYNYKRDEIRQMVSLLDEIIADLRASLGYQRFDVSLVTTLAPAPSRPPLIAAPDARETIDETLAAARLSPSASERSALLETALDALDREAGLAPEWAASARASASALLAHEREVDASYRALHEKAVRDAKTLAAGADVRGVERIVARARGEDAALMNARPDVFAATLAALDGELDAARQLRLARDRWALRRPVLRQYRTAIAGVIERLQRMVPALDDIKSLAGSTPSTIAALLDGTRRIRMLTASIVAPTELQDVHGLLASATQLAENAATLRREATLTGRIDQAWNASSAAAGALMLAARAQQELQSALGLPERRP